MPDAPSVLTTRQKAGSARLSEPQGFDVNGNGGYSVIAKRGNHLDLSDRGCVQRWACGSPLRLLKLLPVLHPDVGAALNNILRLCTAADSVRIEAVRVDDGLSDEMERKGTAALDSLWANGLERQIGGLNGLVSQLIQEAVLTGLPCAEAVPGKRLAGVAEIWPVDSTSVSFRRKEGRVVPLQKQYRPKGAPGFQGYADLDPETFFWHALDAQVDDPYGTPLFGTAVAETLSDLSIMRDVRDALHANAWPRLKFAFNWGEQYKIATEVLSLRDTPGDAAATEWVEQRFADFRALTAGMLADDAIFHPSDADVDNLTPGIGFQALNGTLEFLRARLIQSLKALPSVMGLALGNTETYGSIQWKLYALTLESLRDAVVFGCVLPIADLHLRLLGLPLRAKATIERIQTGEALVDEQVRSLKIKNEAELVRLGVQTQEQFASAFGRQVEDATKVTAFEVQAMRLTEREQVGQGKGSA